MKKFLGILVLSFLWCNIGNALDPEEAKQACKDMGYEVGTEKYTDCSIKLVLKDSKKKERKTFSAGSKKDCSHLKGKKLHKYLACKAGSDRYDNEVSTTSTEVKKKKGESFNEKYNSLTDIFKKIKD